MATKTRDGRGQNDVFRENEYSLVIQHEKLHGNPRGNLGKVEKVKIWNTLANSSYGNH